MSIPDNILYKQILSDDLTNELLHFFKSKNIVSMNGSNLFPQRKR